MVIIRVTVKTKPSVVTVEKVTGLIHVPSKTELTLVSINVLIVRKQICHIQVTLVSGQNVPLTIMHKIN